MPRKSSDLFRFWDELRRRKVVKASLVYLAVAFGIIQAADIIFPRLGLPDWTVTFIIILLIIVFLLIVILTWVYDITPEGIKITETVETEGKEKSPETQVKEDETAKEQAKAEDASELQRKVYDLENQLAEARRITLRKALPLLIKKLTLPLLIMVLLILVVVYKQRIVEVLGFGNVKREEARSHNAAATMYIKSGDLDAAGREVELAFESDPEYSYAWSNLAVISYMQGDLDKAVSQVIKAVSLDSKNSQAPYNLAYLLDDKKDYKQAIYWYKEAIRIDSLNKVDSVYTAASSSLGRLYNSIGLPSNAIIALNRVMGLFPRSKNICFIYKNLGNAYLLQNQIDSSLKYLELSYSLRPVEPETNLFLARAYEASGQINKSIEQWKNYIDLETDTAKINAAIRHRKELAVKQLQEIIK
jgi:tetratricopeptide (TPR) repeat protein